MSLRRGTARPVERPRETDLPASQLRASYRTDECGLDAGAPRRKAPVTVQLECPNCRNRVVQPKDVALAYCPRCSNAWDWKKLRRLSTRRIG